MPQPAAVTNAHNEYLAMLSRAQDRMTAELTAIRADVLAGHRIRRLETLLATVRAEAETVNLGTAAWVRETVPDVYRRGAVSTGLVSGPFTWTQPNRDAVQNIMDYQRGEILKATQFMEDDAKAWWRTASRAADERVAIDGLTPVQAGREMARRYPRAFAPDGVRELAAVIYSDGSRRSLDDYGGMLARTTTANSYNQGTVDQMAATGVQWCEVLDGAECGLTSHDDSDKVNGTIRAVSVMRRYLISHPNCRRALSPRPDITSPEEADAAVPFLDPERAAAQAKVEAQRAADQARRAASPRRRQARAARAEANPLDEARARATRTRRTPRRNGSTLSAQSAEAVQQRAAARLVQGQYTEQVARAQAKRAAQAIRAANAAARAEAAADAANLYGVGLNDVVHGRTQAKALRATFRAAAKDTALAWEDAGALKVKRPPKLIRTRDKITGKEVRRRITPDGVDLTSEYEWLDQLPEAERRRIRRYFTDGGTSPDDIGQAFFNTPGLNTEEAVDLWLDVTRQRDTALAVGSGRQGAGYAGDVGRAFSVGPEAELLGELTERGIDLQVLLGSNLDEAAAAVARADIEQAARYADEILNHRTARPKIWEMSLEDYTAERTAYEASTDQIAGLIRKVESGTATAQEQGIVARFAELDPGNANLGLPDNASMADTWERARRVADEAGL